jgi:hypothetical protein
MTRFQLPQDWKLPELFVHRLGDSVGRQRAMGADGQLLLLLHEPPSPGMTERAGRAFWRDLEGSWRSKGLGDGVHALKRHVTEFGERVEGLEEQLQTAETAADYYVLLRSISPLHRTIRNMHATLQEARNIVPDDRDLINLRDRVAEIERAVELLHGDAKNGLDFTVAYRAEQQAELSQKMAVAGYRLNLLAATFLPVGTLAAVLGMNLVHGLEATNNPVYLWGIAGAGLCGGLMLAALISRKPRATSGARKLAKAQARADRRKQK